MTTYLKKTPKAKPARTCRWLHADPLAAFADGQTVCLALWVGSACDVYDVEPRFSPDGQTPEGWAMRKITPDGEVEEYSIDADYGRCNCPASQWRPNGQPCKHRAALRAALAALESR